VAGILIPAVLLAGPGWICSTAWGKRVLVSGVILLIAPGVFQITARSHELLRVKTLAVGDGRDRFLAFPPELNSVGELVRLTTSALQLHPEDRTVIVIPEGIMINYLARRPSPAAPFVFYAHVTAGEREAELVRLLEQNPPSCVVPISRDLREYGIERYDEKYGSGRAILEWLIRDYETVASVGGGPLDNSQVGAALLRPKASQPGP